MITLKKTCSACPEQYDAYDEDGGKVGYLRLRHGWFSVWDADQEILLYEAYPKGDGIFEWNERDYFLTEAVNAIQRGTPIQEEPDPTYEVIEG